MLYSESRAMHVHPSRLRYRRITFVLLAATCAIGLLLFGNILFSRHPHQLYAQAPSTSAATLVVQTLDDALVNLFVGSLAPCAMPFTQPTRSRARTRLFSPMGWPARLRWSMHWPLMTT